MIATGELADGLASLAGAGVKLPDVAADQLERYLDLLEKWNRTYNLTAVRERSRMATHHLLDSLAVLPYLPTQPQLRLLDVGSGPGLPGIPLAIARPDWSVTVLDSSHKKGAFMQQAVAELGLANVEVCVARVEALARKASFDVVISRAFADLRTFAESSRALLAPGGRLMAMKGVLPHEELADVPATVRVVATHRVAVPGLEAERHLVVMEGT